MQPREKINRAAWNLLEGAKDVVQSNLVLAVRDGRIKVEASQMEALMKLIASSIDEGYHRANATFMKVVEQCIPVTGAEAPKQAKKKST